MVENYISIKIGGEAGQGMESSGAGFAKVLARGGLYVYGLSDFMSRIRGGHNFFQIRASENPVYTHTDDVHLLLAFNEETIDLHKDEVVRGGGIIYDSEFAVDSESIRSLGITPMPMPLIKMAREIGGDKVMQNTAAVGAAAGMTGYPFSGVENVITQNFKRKGDEVVNGNLKVARAAYDYAADNFAAAFAWKLHPVTAGPRMMINGNQAIALGAIAGGLKFISAYPMTPATTVIEYITSQANRFGVLTKQTEDELAALLQAIGAAHAGVRAMTATSGGGFCLMVESLGLAAMTETPVVIVIAQRGGPSTGLPTRTEQSDLEFVIHASHGEFPRIILAPGTVEQCFTAGWRALNLAEKYQTPVLILTDLMQAFAQRTVEPSAIDAAAVTIERGELLSEADLDAMTDEYKRHLLTPSGVSPRAVPGSAKSVYITTGDEHTEYGYITEDGAERMAQMEKRMRKQELAANEIAAPAFYGPSGASLTLMGWGSTYGALREAADLLNADGISTNVLHFSEVWPLPVERVLAILESCTYVVDVEMNYTGQLANVLREFTGFDAHKRMLKYDGRPFSPEEIVSRVKNEVMAHV